MLKTAFFYFTFWAALIFCAILLIPYYLLKIVGIRNVEKRFVNYVTSRWARLILFINGVRYTVYGKENFPETHSGFVVISNHQGNFDIPVCIGCLPFSVGFISKKELMNFPLINYWMKALDCFFIDRNKPRESTKKMRERIGQTDKNPIFLFPEGTRSKGPQMGPFKPGSLKLLFQERIDVLPVTISGSYKCMEKYNNVKSARVEVFFHPVLHTSNYQPEEFDRFNMDLHKIIAGPLEKEV